MEIVLSLLLAVMLGAMTGWVVSIVLKREDLLVWGIVAGIAGAALAGWLVPSLKIGGGPLLLMVLDIAAAFLLVFLLNLVIRKKG